MASFSMIFRSMLKMGTNGPSALSISLRFLVSVWFMAPISGAAIR